VFDVAAALSTEKEPRSIAMTEIAERAGVAVTTLYGRWREVGSLLLEVAVGQLNREQPLPDTGSRWGSAVLAQKIATALRSKRGSALFKVIVQVRREAASVTRHVCGLWSRGSSKLRRC
jgi:AcrR family transcriptional regulator